MVAAECRRGRHEERSHSELPTGLRNAAASTQGLGLVWQAWPQLLQLCFGRNVPQVSDPETQIQEKVVYLGSSRYTSRVGS